MALISTDQFSENQCHQWQYPSHFITPTKIKFVSCTYVESEVCKEKTTGDPDNQ